MSTGLNFQTIFSKAQRAQNNPEHSRLEMKEGGLKSFEEFGRTCPYTTRLLYRSRWLRGGAAALRRGSRRPSEQISHSLTFNLLTDVTTGSIYTRTGGRGSRGYKPPLQYGIQIDRRFSFVFPRSLHHAFLTSRRGRKKTSRLASRPRSFEVVCPSKCSPPLVLIGHARWK